MLLFIFTPLSRLSVNMSKLINPRRQKWSAALPKHVHPQQKTHTPHENKYMVIYCK